MKTRIFVSVIGIPLILLVVFLLPLWVLGSAVGVVSAIAAYELLNCALPGLPKRFVVYAASACFLLGVGFSVFGWSAFALVPALLLLVLLVCELVISYQKDPEDKRLDFEDIVVVLFAGACLPIMLSSIVRIGLRDNAPLYIMLAFISAFASDSGAYFVGTSLGKHKLIPKVSPSKTIEGSVGGFLFAVIMMLLYGILLMFLDFKVNFLAIGIYGFLGSAACQIGDLFFSAIKRARGIKDYSGIIPGHGGILDRFDGLLFTAPVIEILILWVAAFI